MKNLKYLDPDHIRYVDPHRLKYLDPHRRATWLELFFDLIFAVTIGDVTQLLSRTPKAILPRSSSGNSCLLLYRYGGYGPATRCTQTGSTPATILIFG
jgi:hypothetical protein